MIIDCERCAVRGDACRDCVVGVFLSLPGSVAEAGEEPSCPSGARTLQLDAPERRALDVLAEHGLVPKLRLAVAAPQQVSPTSGVWQRLSDVG
jgi:hypothetical protein